MINWSKIDTVLLDMDGTLLDLRFDNYFWRTVVPKQYAKQEGISLEQAVNVLAPIFKKEEGKLNWYCLDFWSEQLSIDIVELKRQAKVAIEVLPNTRDFLMALKRAGIRSVLVTNAHKDSLTLKMQQTGLIEFFNATICAHDIGYPKEHRLFWQCVQRLEGFKLRDTLFIDDSISILKSAEAFGIEQIVAISCPDSTQAPNQIDGFIAVEHVGELLPIQ